MEMRKNLKWLIAIAVAGLLAIAIAIPIIAAGPNGANNSSPTETQSCCGNGNRRSPGIGVDEAVTSLLGMTREEIQAERQVGKSLVQIASGKGINEETLVNTIMVEKQEALQEMVAAGTSTQAQADQRLEQMRERVQLAVNRTTIRAPEWAGQGQGGPQLSLQNCTRTPGTCTGQGRMMRAGRNSQ